VGKSTELTRLIHETRSQFRAIRFSALEDLNPSGYKPFDVLLVMLIKLVEETNSIPGVSLSPALLRDVIAWFAQKTKTYKTDTEVNAELSAGGGVKDGFPINIVLGLFASIKGLLKYSTHSENTVVQYELAMMPELAGLVNRLLSECRRILEEAEQKEWIFIGEDFDKAIGSPELAKDLFINYAGILYNLQAHFIFNLSCVSVWVWAHG